jgi:tRNA(fMet)-specific endonuclease VapC
VIGNNFLVDTNIIIEVFDGNQEIADKINETPRFYISTIILGELHIGINRVSNKAKHLKKLNLFLDLCDILIVDAETSKYFGEITASQTIFG